MAELNLNKNGRPALYILMGALLFNLSALPGVPSEVAAYSTDLLSLQFLKCDISGDLNQADSATCENLEKNKVRGSVRVDRVGKSEKFKVTSQLEGEFCLDGTCEVSQTVDNRRDLKAIAMKLFNEHTSEVSKALAKEEEHQKNVKLCLVDEDGKPITNDGKIMECRLKTWAGLTAEEREEYYAEIKEDLQALVQSKDAYHRALGLNALTKMIGNPQATCTSQQAVQSRAQSQSLLNPGAANSPAQQGSFMKESSCDLWIFGAYNQSMENLKLAAAQPGVNKALVASEYQKLRSGWGTYLQQRGLVLQQNPFAMNGMADQVFADFSENGDFFKKQIVIMDQIIARHQDLIKAPPGNPNPAAAPAAGVYSRAGGVAVPAQNSAGVGTVATGSPAQPWASTPGAKPTLMQPGRPIQGPFPGAPKFGMPVK